MSIGHPKDKPNPDPLLARLIEMEALVKRQTSALNALEVERDHFKGAFEEADAERQRLELVIRQLLRAQFGRKSERLDPEQFQLTLENLEQEIAAATAPTLRTATGTGAPGGLRPGATSATCRPISSAMRW
jgi:hypothetical protein